MYLASIDTQRFWKKVNKTTNCWEWTGWRNKTGMRYGRFDCNGKKYLAHRVSFILSNGFIPDGLLVLHQCDNPICVRPDHLFKGTNLDNAADRDNKGRLLHHKGENHKSSKLTQVKVNEIRSRHSQGETQTSLAKEFEISQTNISRIILRLIWKT